MYIIYHRESYDHLPESTNTEHDLQLPWYMS